MKLDITIQNDDAVRDMLKELGPFTKASLAKTLNQTANRAQNDIQGRLPQAFTMRRSEFVRRTIYRDRTIDFATPGYLAAAVRVNPSQDVLAKFEEGGDKTPVSGRTVAIPMPTVRRNAGGIIPRAMRPSGLMGKAGVRKLTTNAGTFIVQSKRKYGAMGARTEFLYRLVPSVRIQPRLKFVETATKAVDESFVRIALANLDGIGR